jgi:cytochrome c553
MNRLIKLAGLALLLPLMAVNVQAATPSSRTLQLTTGEIAKVGLGNIKGSVTVSSSNSAVASATLSSRTVSVTAAAPGSAILSVRDSKGTATISVTVKAPMTVTPTSLSLSVGGSATITVSNPSGSVRLGNSDTRKVMAFLQNNVVTATGKAAGQAILTIRDNKTTKTVTVQVTAGQTGATVNGTTTGRLLASNCFQCHGTYGSGGFDKLLRKSESELLEELNGFAQGKEDANGIMAAHARGYTPEQLQAIAKYLANP